MQILLLLLTILGGMGLSVEAGLLGPLGKEVGELWATFSIFGVGAALTFLLMLFFSPRNSPSLTSPFVNSDTAPSLVDFTGAMGTGTQRNIQIRYQHIVDAKQKLLVALEGGDVENKNIEGGSRFPALTMRYEFKNPNLLVQLHGMLHENRAISNANEKQTKLAWGVGLGTKGFVAQT